MDSLIQSHCKYLSFEYDHLESWEEQEWMHQAAQDCASPLADSQRWSIFKYLVQAGAVTNARQTVAHSTSQAKQP